MLRPMIAMSYAWSVSIALIVVFFVVFPLLANGLIGIAAGVAAGEKRQNEEYEEAVTARK